MIPLGDDPPEPLIDLAPGAEGSPLAVRLADLVRGNLRVRPAKLADFRALRGTVLIVARDTGDSLTMRFDHGRLTIHDGAVGVPTVSLLADLDDLFAISDVPLTRIGRLPIPRPGDPIGRARVGRLAGLVASGELKIYGLAAHPRFVLRLLRVVSVH
jgi:hypothetical protein